ncbi:hypothetical protein SAMN05661096_01880 [Marivirga sericea]|uniref:Uncharacterized protein n=1 Tax=Marivirga sericea TaxID=1028 RepID=A0A1X7JNT9_9BACT|nr:hypothetical protein [Marivirga sericea]SMG29625.1 hypothetical protein SAMN05661096_01880 [Marivirga sericea]
MKNIKKVLVYPLAFVLFFGLTANECLDSFEDVAIDVAIEEVKIIPVKVTQQMYDSLFELQGRENVLFQLLGEFTASEETIDEYGDRVQELNVTELRIKAVNVTERPQVGTLVWMYGQSTPGSIDSPLGGSPINFEDLEAAEQKVNISAEDIQDLQSAILKKEKIEYVIQSDFSGPAIFDLELTIVGTLKVTAAE